MTVDRTRQIFGNKVAHFSDEEILLFIQQTGSFIDSILDTIVTDFPNGKITDSSDNLIIDGYEKSSSI